ncbi:MAG: ribonuclease H-like YkuK family protein [Patescibacteria group bacterium]|nr:ribonuclease H-like YkuK family protein [Patescibacteria group bacterium]
MGKIAAVPVVETQALFMSPSLGLLNFEQVLNRVKNYIKEEDNCRYRIIVGTDSAPHNGEHTEYITALVLHRVGLGGIYFWQKTIKERARTLRERIYEEALLSIDFAKILLERFLTAELLDLDLEIHVDVGKVGETREIITEVVGLVRGNGFHVKTKPESFGASKVADRHT